tara:strand:- start:387 stop:680 length:294 start_codon:yes stop_codon:yes gene_type:complete
MKYNVNEKLIELNKLEMNYSRYVVNCDNIYSWACDTYNTEKPTDKQLESICEYPLNYSDYYRNIKVIDSMQKKIIKDLKDNHNVNVEYNGDIYIIVQ